MEPHKKEQRTENGNQTLQPSHGILDTNASSIHSKVASHPALDKPNFNQEQVDPASGLQSNQSQQAPGGQQPSKKKGFQITSVKDPGDGEESADELDESHTSYSDMSYSRTTDMDHDQESSASEDTLNTTVQDGIQSLPAASATAASGTDASSKVGVKPAQNVVVNHAQSAKVGVTKEEQKQELTKSPVSSPVVEVKDPALGDKTTMLPHVSQAAQSKAPPRVAPGTTQAGETTTPSTSTTSKATPAAGGTLAKGGASRVYKVVKRESYLPVKRERGRWTCYDYLDSLSPNLSFVVQSASDTRLNYQEQMSHTPNNLPLSMSATSVPSSASSYSLQHSDSNSSVYRDSHHVAAAPSSVQHSASTSSVNYDLETRRLQKQANIHSVAEGSEDKHRSSLEERTETSGDVIKSAIKSYVDMNTSEDEGASTSSGRIDNKIEAAMDLVKKHLMLAVRDEVDELKEKIVILENEKQKMKKENDLLKGFLTSEQWVAVQQVLKQVITQPQKSCTAQPVQSSIPVYSVPVQGVPAEKLPPTASQVTPTHQPHAHTGPVIANAAIHHGYGQQAATGTGNVQLQPIHVNPGVVNQGGVVHVQQQSTPQVGSQTMQHIPQIGTIQQPNPGNTAAATSVQTQFQQPQALYQQAQLTQQQVQALIQQQQQQQQVYPQGQLPTGQATYQAAPQQSQVTPNLTTQPTYQGPNAYAQGHAAAPYQQPQQQQQQPQQAQAPAQGVGVQRPVAQPAALVMPRQAQQQPQQAGILSVTSPTNTVPPQNQQAFQTATPTHVASPAPTHSTYVQQAAVPSSGKAISETRAPQS